MRHLITSLTLVCFLSPLTLAAGEKTTPKGKASEKKLHGTWVVRVQLDEAKAKKLFPANVPADTIDQALAKMKMMFAKMKISLTLKPDGTWTSQATGPDPKNPTEITSKKENGTWSFVQAKGKTATLKISEKKADGKTESHKIKIEWVDRNTFKLIEDPTLGKAPIKTPVFKRMMPKKSKKAKKAE